MTNLSQGSTTTTEAVAGAARDSPQPRSTLRAAIIGTGMIAAVHARAIRAANGHVVGILGRTPTRSDESAEQLNIERGYTDLDELIADRPDVVHICSPNDQHHPQALAVIAAGINVVCEKPLAISAAQADELAEAASVAGVVATVPFAYRFHPVVREIRARIAAGDLGRVLSVHGSYLQDWMLNERASNWRVDATTGGPSRAFADIGSHWCDIVEFVTGERLESVSASADIVYEYRPAAGGPAFSATQAGSAAQVQVTTEDTAAATFRTASGRLVNVVVSQVAAGRKSRLWFEVDGSLKSAVFDQENPESAWFGTETGAEIFMRSPSHGSADQRRLSLIAAGHPQGYLDAFAAFVADTYAAIRTGKVPDGLPTFADGARAAHIIDAVVASIGSGSQADVG